MFERAIEASRALRDAMQHNPGTLVPALCGCPQCQTIRMISSPALGRCEACGSEIVEIRAQTKPTASARWFEPVPDAA